MKRILILLIIFLALFTFHPIQVPALMVGLHMDLTYDGHAWRRANAISAAKSVLASVSRNSFMWHLIEPQKGSYNWSRTDAIIQELANAGIEPLFCIYGSPSWANGVSTSTADYHLYVPTDATKFQEWLNNYKVFVSAAVTRYMGRVKKWELWNEQNEHYFWKPKPNLDQYAQWFKEIYSVIKSIDPSAEVALGGLTGLNASGPQDINGKTFLAMLYQKSIFPYIIAIHPYAMKYQSPDTYIQWENNFTDIKLIYDIMVAHGQGNKKIWVTEWGWPTDKISENDQANYVYRSLQMIKSLYPFVTVATYFLDYDRIPHYYQGLFTSDFKMKPSGLRFRDFIQRELSTLSPPKYLRVQ